MSSAELMLMWKLIKIEEVFSLQSSRSGNPVADETNKNTGKNPLGDISAFQTLINPVKNHRIS